MHNLNKTSVRLPTGIKKEIGKAYPKLTQSMFIRLAIQYTISRKPKLVEGVGMRFEDKGGEQK
jgi:hypothetical protein